MVKLNATSRKAGLSGRLADTDIRLLRIYKSVVENGGFSAAEVDLNISRAAISMAISDLETRLALKLCQRGRSGFAVTDQGKEVYQAMLQLLSALEDFKTQVNSLHSELKGELNIGITDNLVTMPQMTISHALKKLKQQGPEVTVNIKMSPPDEIEIGVLDGRLHLGVVPIFKPLKGLNYIPLYEETCHLYCSQQHPLFELNEQRHSKTEIQKHDAVLAAFAQPSAAKKMAQQLHGSATASDREGIAFLILTGQYIGYLPTHYAERWLLQGSIRALMPKTLSFKVQYAVITRKGARPNRVLENYLEHLNVQT